jgi:hypothetical protein
MRRAVFLTPLLVFVFSCKDAPARAPEALDTAGARPQPAATLAAPSSPAGDVVARSADCPAFSRSARIASQPIVDGAELVFWTSDDTATLRRRVSTLSLPSVATSADFRTDNIHNGIRLVFVSDDASEVVPLRLAVHNYAKEIATRCGVTYAPPKPQKKRTDPTSAGSSSSSSTKAGTSSKTSGADTKKPSTAASAASAASATPAQPKPPQAPASSSKRPSGPIPDPFAPPPAPAPSPPSNPFK